MTEKLYMTDLRQRCPVNGELYLMSEERNAIARCTRHESRGPSVILTPVSPGAAVGECVLVERLREAYDELYASRLRGDGDDALRTLANVVTMRAHEIVVAVPPPAPADPLESAEFKKDVENLFFSVGGGVDGFRMRIADAIRKWGPRAGGAK